MGVVNIIKIGLESTDNPNAEGIANKKILHKNISNVI